MLQIRDGKLNDDTSILLDESSSCSTLTNYIVTASASWLLVQFRSDGLNYSSGFQGYISSTYVGMYDSVCIAICVYHCMYANVLVIQFRVRLLGCSKYYQ